MIYVTCRYAPVELFSGFGESSQLLDPEIASFGCSEECAHPNLCSYAKSVIEEVHAKHIKQLVLTDCCDAMRRTFDVLKENEEMDFLWLLPLPHRRSTVEVRLFSTALKEMVEAYASFSGKTFDESLARKACESQLQRDNTVSFSKFIAVDGAHGGSQLVRQVKEEFPYVPVIDRTCTGSRRLVFTAQNSESFYDWYADILLNQKHPCMRMWKREEKSEKNVLGTVFHIVKFCDYYSFEWIKEKDRAVAPIVRIETDMTTQTTGQLSTRLDAFAEEIGMKNHSGRAAVKKDGQIYTAGIDSGSASTDAVIMNSERKILARAIIPTGAGAKGTALMALQKALKDAGLSREDISLIVSTGYGRNTIDIDSIPVTEITCHGRGANYLDPKARTVIDIGGQDSKVISIDENGRVLNFVMNDKCAAGTGRFLETQSKALGLSMEQMSEKGLSWKHDITITSMCTVFAESEVVSLVADNVPVEDIIHGLNKSIAAKTFSLLGRLKGKPEYIMTGGVAKNKGIVQCMEEKLKERIYVDEDAQVCGAIGAALIGLERVEEDGAVH